MALGCELYLLCAVRWFCEVAICSTLDYVITSHTNFQHQHLFWSRNRCLRRTLTSDGYRRSARLWLSGRLQHHSTASSHRHAL